MLFTSVCRVFTIPSPSHSAPPRCAPHRQGLVYLQADPLHLRHGTDRLTLVTVQTTPFGYGLAAF